MAGCCQPLAVRVQPIAVSTSGVRQMRSRLWVRMDSAVANGCLQDRQVRVVIGRGLSRNH